MEEDTEYKKLPVEEQVVHKLWKARLHGYEELTKQFRQIDDEKSPEFARYLGLVKKFVVDSNAVSQEKGLEAVLAYVECYANAGKTVGEVMSGIVTKCIAAPKTRTKELAVQVTLMYVEIEKQDAVQEELLKGTELKNPKIVAACVSAATLALREFGSKVINVKPLIKKMAVLLADRDKTVRDEAKAMVVEIFRWIGGALRPQLANLQPVQVTELEAEFARAGAERAVPTRYLRSQQQRQAKLAAEAADDDEHPDDGQDEPTVEVDPYDLAEPVNVLARLPADFYDKLEAKKWQERKEAVDVLDGLLRAPKLESGEYGDLVRALRKAVAKDTNVMVVAAAGRCLAALAAGLKKRFQPYAAACLPTLLEKFREKKQNVVAALRDALDAVFLSTSVEAVLEDVLEALANKNPAVKAETASFLARAFARSQPLALNKKTLKAYTVALLRTLNEPDPTVRDSSAEALGTAMKLVGEKAIAPFLAELDALKLAKIRECCERAVLAVRPAAPRRDRPATAPPPPEGAPARPAATVRRPATAAASAKRKTVAGSVGPAASAARSAKGKQAAGRSAEPELSAEEIEERAEQLLGSDALAALADSNWKARLAAVERYQQAVRQTEPGTVSTQVLVGVLNRKPGLRDTNIQVQRAKLETLKLIAETHKMSTVSADACLNDVIDKLGDAKNSSVAAEVLTLMAESTKLDHVANAVLDYGCSQKNPRVQQESLLWVSTALKEFGLALNPKVLVENAKRGLAATNPAVRTAAITLFGTLYLYMGPALHAFVENEKPATRQLISAEFDRCEGERPPEPTRGLAAGKPREDADDVADDDEPVADSTFCLQDLPRVDVSAHFSESLINELSDKNWKVRNEALQKVQAVLTDAKLIQPSVGDLPQALAARLADSNGKIAQTALQICQALAAAMGPACKQHVRLLFPRFLQGLGDSKAWIRTASVACINTWGDQCGYRELFDGEMVGDALRIGSPALRAELWAWLADKLPALPAKQVAREELLACLPVLYTNLEDRNVDVRKRAQDVVLPFMVHLGYECMCKHTEKLKPGSKAAVAAVLERARPSLPVKPLPKNRQQAPIEREARPAGRGPRASAAGPGSSGTAAVRSRPSGVAAAKPPAVSRKKDDDVDLSPLLVVNNLKHQRVIDEQRLRVLKWNFTQPREEFVELLRDQMTAANVNKGLVANMFHPDFRYHLKAIESLTDDLEGNGGALVSNLDLVLKWLTLRFFDTNPSVLLKGLEYLQLVFGMLVDNGYVLLENEASSFIPYLILKVGDPKDAVRNGVRALFEKIGLVYPVSKLFSYIMEGLKSKNARQRTECLEELGNLIRGFGIVVCQPTPAAALKEVAKQISDRDNSVRNAALNCVVQAYQLEGEKVLKLIGQISDKDNSLLEERIKRAGKRMSAPPPQQQQLPQPRHSTLPVTAAQRQTPSAASVQPPPPLSREPSDLDTRSDEELMDDLAPPPPENEAHSPESVHDRSMIEYGDSYSEKAADRADENSGDEKSDRPEKCTASDMDRTTVVGLEQADGPEAPHTPPPVQRPVTGPYGLDPDFLREIENFPVVVMKPKLVEVDLSFLDEPVVLPEKPKITPLSPPRRVQPSQSYAVRPTPFMNPRFGQELLVEKAVSQMREPDLKVALNAIYQMELTLRNVDANMMVQFEDQFMAALTQQLRLLHSQNPTTNPDVLKMYRAILTVMAGFYDNKSLGQRLTRDVLRDIMHQLITLLVEQKLEKYESGDAYCKVINVQCVKIMERSNHTTLVCALINLLHSSVGSACSARFLELAMKCLWRVTKAIPTWCDDIEYDTILYEIHVFFRDYPSSWWKQRSDTPIRTIKTIVHTMAKIKGNSLLNHLSRIENKNESELQSYLLKLLKTLKLEEVKQIPLKREPRRPLSRAMHDTLTEIFQKIGSKEATKDGLVMLYEFKQRNPDADISPYLERSSLFFQEYIERGLRDIELSHRKSAPPPSAAQAASVDPPDSRRMLARLRSWQRLAGLPTTPQLEFECGPAPQVSQGDRKSVASCLNAVAAPADSLDNRRKF